MNADIRYYTVNPDRTLTLTRVNSTHVGKNISTKALGSNAREDVTLGYKFAEGSTSERAALLGRFERGWRDEGMEGWRDGGMEAGRGQLDM